MIDAGEALETIRSRASDLDRGVREFTRKRPIVAVLGALLLGFLTARATSRRLR
jgi:hypothetical protein